MDLLADLQARTIPHRMLILNGSHYDIDDPAIWPKPVMLDWFDYWLKDAANGIIEGPAVTYAVQGSTDEWRTTTVWPPQGTVPTTLTLGADGSLAETIPQATFGERSFVYDPANPTPTLGGRQLFAPSGMLDQRPVLPPARDDVIVYTGQPLSDDLLLAGPVSATLWVRSDAPDTDFVVKLIHLHPDGTANLMLDDLVRVRYRNGRDQLALLRPGETVALQFDLGHVAHRIPAGHQLQLSVSSSNFPAWDRNLNTGSEDTQNTEMRVATNTVVSNAQQKSTLQITVEP
jgi:putative CocE/NonD family hydrolase